ncbi:MAG: hypothetical protein JWQ87_2221 [Candidatus Sulfotelmatobacter sp.]|nr:hypothetical protein [Candidatus Sulfotelmatobacter sp.]
MKRIRLDGVLVPDGVINRMKLCLQEFEKSAAPSLPKQDAAQMEHSIWLHNIRNFCIGWVSGSR